MGESNGGQTIGFASSPAPATSYAPVLDGSRSIVTEFSRYLMVGGLAFLVDFGSLYVLTQFGGLHYLISAPVAFLFGLATNYCLSRIWVFDRRTTQTSFVEFVLFAMIGVVGLGFNEGILWLVQDKVHVHYLFAKVISAGTVLLWNFSARRSLLFSGRPIPGFVMRLTPPLGASPLLSACQAAVCLTFCLIVQGVSAAWSADFLAYPDEPSHFVGAVMVRDWLSSGRWLAPLEFARNYYDHYPFFAIGYWPPLFSAVTGLWMAVAGVGRLQALLIPALFAAGTGWLVSRFVQKWASGVIGLCAGILYLSLPAVRLGMCAVMVDHMTAFLCIASAVCLLRYLRQPLLWNGILCAVCCAGAILSKYSAAYTLVLPFGSILLLRRFELLRKPSFLVQPVIVALIVGPWSLWTRELAFYGLPTDREPLTVSRAASFVLGTFTIFPPILMAVVVVGLVFLLLLRSAWREDLAVLSVLCAGHLAFLILSPVAVDQRYLFVPAAALLVASFAGWSAVLALMPHAGRLTGFLTLLVAVFTTVYVASQFGNLARIRHDRIKEVVSFVAKQPAIGTQRVVVPPTLEGPVIAEFVAQARTRPDQYLLRPSKILARSDWFVNYSSTFASPEEMMEYFRHSPVDLVIWRDQPEPTLEMHARIMSKMLHQYPLSWRRVLSLGSAGHSAASWSVYEFHMPPQKPSY